LQDDPHKREIINRRHFSFRLNIFFFLIFLLFSVLIVQLAILQFVEGPTLSAAGANKSQRSDEIAPIRGNIYDSTGYPIAYSTSTQSLYYKIQSGYTEADSVKVAENLHAVFAEYGNPEKAMTVEDIVRQMDLDSRRNIGSTPRRIKSGLTNEEIAYFMENRTSFTGIEIMEESVRNYDKNSIAVQLVGYLKKYKGVRADNAYYKAKMDEKDPKLKYLEEEEVGLDGIELMYQEVLRGKNGLKTYPINNAGRIIGPMEITNPEKGADLFLTINKNVQLKTESAILEHIDKIKKSSNRYERAQYAQIGYAVAIEVETGKVVSMASMPDYDPNIWAGGSISIEDYDNFQYALSNGTIRDVYGKYDTDEERARHPSSVVPPGSTLKPLSVLVGLSEKLFKTNYIYNDTGVFTFGRKGYERNIKNSQNHIYGNMDPARAIEKSSNPFMAEMIGNALYKRGGVDGKKAIDIWDEYMKMFGLGITTGSGLPNESKGVIDYYSETMGSEQSALIFSSFGQGAKYTTLQLAQYAATLASRGVRYKPQFVNEIRESDGTLVEGFTPEVLNTIDLPEDYWKEIESGMSKVSVQGFEDFPYDYRRKTGTSESDVAGRRAENAVFIAYAPADKPKLAVAVVIPDGGFGSYGAAPIARKIFDAYDEEIGLTGTPRKKPANEPIISADGAGQTDAGDANAAGAGVDAGASGDTVVE